MAQTPQAWDCRGAFGTVASTLTAQSGRLLDPHIPPRPVPERGIRATGKMLSGGESGMPGPGTWGATELGGLWELVIRTQSLTAQPGRKDGVGPAALGRQQA